ncbi:MAG: hypothetical protein ACT6XY_05685 [Phreatobacter sp.]|jgi:hypothetical protein|uniref:hypothetical protein n=1 Tax=Phreatobacter sp. TaxID=1966341 RepID=UPI004035D34E
MARAATTADFAVTASGEVIPAAANLPADVETPPAVHEDGPRSTPDEGEPKLPPPVGGDPDEPDQSF